MMKSQHQHNIGFVFFLEFCSRNCPSADMFNYISESEGAVVATCLLCHIKLHEPDPNEMAWHHKQCSKGRRINNIRNVIDDGASNEIQYIFESAVSQRELDGQRKVNRGISAPGFLIKLVQTSKGLERNSECQVCKKTKVKPSQTYFTVHRLVYNFPIHNENLFIKLINVSSTSRHCQIPGEVLLSVSTQPFDMTISSSIDDSQNLADSNRICFICNTSTSESFVSLYETLSQHSNTPVYDFVWKFLDNKPSVRDDSIDAANSDWSSLCAGCLNKINEYDLACMTAANLEEELRWELSQTEDIYTRQHNAVVQEEVEQAVEMPPAPMYVDVSEEAINLDSLPPAEVITTTHTENIDPIDNVRCTIELSDDEEPQTIELSDDDS